MLDLHRLFLLRELATRGTVSAVADALHYSRSAVSQQLTKLEQEINADLFERVGRTLQLTDTGHRLLEYAEQLLNQAERAEADLEAATDREVRGRLRVGLFQTAAVQLLPAAIASLNRDHPALEVNTVEANPEQTMPALRLGDLDLVLAQAYDHAPLPLSADIHSEMLLRDPVKVALPRAHALARKKHPVDLRCLADDTWVTGEAGTGLGDMVLRICVSLGGFTPEIRYLSNDLTVMQSLVAAGHAVALVPELAHVDASSAVVTRAIEQGPFARDILLLSRHTNARRAAVRAFADAIEQAIGDGQEPSAKPAVENNRAGRTGSSEVARCQ